MILTPASRPGRFYVDNAVGKQPPSAIGEICRVKIARAGEKVAAVVRHRGVFGLET
jgi:ribosomal protein S12